MQSHGRAGVGAVGTLVATAALVLASGPSAARARPSPAATPERCRAAVIGAGEQSPRTDCCFTNPAYTGVCVVQPAKGETCATILAFLNDPQSQGKTYCESTTLRGGWQEVPCKKPGAAAGAPER